jgi:SM-20-related protein
MSDIYFRTVPRAPRGPHSEVPDDVPVRLNPRLDVARIAQVFQRFGRVHIPDILAPETAERLHQCLTKQVPWSLAYNEGGRGGHDDEVEVPPSKLSRLAPAQLDRIARATHPNATENFQYLYKAFQISRTYSAAKDPSLYVYRVLEFLNGQPFIAFARAVTGAGDVELVNAIASLYERGHYLTHHDDQEDSHRRRAAYVFNFTPRWRPDWGGLLQFYSADGHVSEAYAPVFNGLNIFRVPQPHAVSYVTPFAGAGRYSLTGWFWAPQPGHPVTPV